MKNDPLRLDDLPGSEALLLPFSWQELPRQACAAGGYTSVGSTAFWTTHLIDGREVRLTMLHQYLTYAGVLAGLPTSDDVRGWPIEGALRIAGDLIDFIPSKIAILPPELLVSSVAGKGGTRREVEFLPPVCSIGTLESKALPGDHSDGTEVGLIWFQRSFGPPEAGHVVGCIQRMEWDKYAYDFHSM